MQYHESGCEVHLRWRKSLRERLFPPHARGVSSDGESLVNNEDAEGYVSVDDREQEGIRVHL